MSGPSDKAVEHARDLDSDFGGRDEDVTREVLDLAHDPALGLDRSVCLRDVVEVVRMWSNKDPEVANTARNAGGVVGLIEQVFGGAGKE